jgi:hypothetical protein
MKTKRTKLQEIADVASQLAALPQMGVPELRDRYLELYGVPTTNTSPQYLRKKLAWRIQELAEGGLSEQAKARIEELAGSAPLRFRASRSQQQPIPPSDSAEKGRDPRLPPPGTEIVRSYQGDEHRVTVLRDGFQYKGTRYATLSKVAREISGTRWNGFLFFHLTDRSRSGAKVPR